MMRTLLAFGGGGLGYLVAAPVVLAGLPFWVLGTLTRAAAKFLSPQTVEWNELIQFDPVVGWRPKASLRAMCQAAGADVFAVESDAEGWCGSGSLDSAQLVIFGDSYAFGYAVNRPFFRASQSGLRVKAVAAPGYSMVQELILMRQLAPRLRGKLVVWFVYPGNDLTDNLCPAMQGYRTPFVRECAGGAGWEIVSRHLQPDKWPIQRRYDRGYKISAVFGKNRTSDRVYAACEFLIARGQSACARAGADLAVVLIPWNIQLEPLPWPGVDDVTVDPCLPERKIGETCASLGVRFVPGSRYLHPQHYIPGEGHLNEEGHRRLAMILQELYASQQSRPPFPVWSRTLPVCEQA